VTVPIKQAAFDAPSLEAVRGRIRYVVKNGSGTTRPAKTFTKDGGVSYFVHATF
jgi:hypothetical protein